MKEELFPPPTRTHTHFLLIRNIILACILIAFSDKDGSAHLIMTEAETSDETVLKFNLANRMCTFRGMCRDGVGSGGLFCTLCFTYNISLQEISSLISDKWYGEGNP